MVAKNVVGARRSSLKVISSIEEKISSLQFWEKTEGSEKKQQLANELRDKIETEVRDICGEVHSLLNEYVIPMAESHESEVFYLKMKADYFRDCI